MYAGQKQSAPLARPDGITETRQSEVGEEFARLTRAVDHLSMTANQLTDRLHAVRSQTGNESGKAESQPEPVLCPMADSIRAQRKSIEACQSVLQAALSELEL